MNDFSEFQKNSNSASTLCAWAYLKLGEYPEEFICIPLNVFLIFGNIPAHMHYCPISVISNNFPNFGTLRVGCGAGTSGAPSLLLSFSHPGATNKHDGMATTEQLPPKRAKIPEIKELLKDVGALVITCIYCDGDIPDHTTYLVKKEDFLKIAHNRIKPAAQLKDLSTKFSDAVHEDKRCEIQEMLDDLAYYTNIDMDGWEQKKSTADEANPEAEKILSENRVYYLMTSVDE